MPKTLDCYCSICGHKTHHEIISEAKMQSNRTDDFWWAQYYRVVKCLGCDNVSFNLESMDESSIDYDSEGNEYLVPSFDSFPVPEGRIGMVEFTWHFPSEIYGIYRESVEALNHKCYRLAAAGFRATVEAICIDKGITSKNLEAKINGLKKAGIITEADRNRLHSIRFMGNDSIHEMKEPNKDSLLLVLEIINGILNNLYIIEEKTKNKLESPIKTIQDFIKLLDEGLQTKTVGDIDILKNLLPVNRRLIKDDLSRFESALQAEISSGDYTKLSLCPPPSHGRNQQYKVESIG